MSIVRTIGRFGDRFDPNGRDPSPDDPTQAPTLRPLSSSNIAQAGYNDATRVLRVQFVNGSIYDYFDVPPEVYEALIKAPSHGSYHYHNIRMSFGYKMVSGSSR